MHSVTAAIPSYNGRHLLEILLPSLARQTHPPEEVVVVDDGSSDDTVEWLRVHWPGVEVIALEDKVGVTAAINLCLRAGQCELVALFNNDIELEPRCIEELVSALERHPEAASAAAKLMSFHDREVIDGAGDYYVWGGEANRRGQGTRDAGQYELARETFGACGGAALYRREALRDVGLFDEQFYALQEDVDWSFRARLLGYSCRYVPSAVAYHMGSETIGRGLNEFVLYHNWRNGIWVVLKNYPGRALLKYAHRVIDMQLHTLVWAVETRRVRVFVRAWRDALRGMPAIMHKRRALQRSRVIGLEELERIIDP